MDVLVSLSGAIDVVLTLLCHTVMVKLSLREERMPVMFDAPELFSGAGSVEV